MIICLCGSTRFKKQFEEAAAKLTMAGHIVLMPNVFKHTMNREFSDKEIAILTMVHGKKISMCDLVVIINGDVKEDTWHVGEHTLAEWCYSEVSLKPCVKWSDYYYNIDGLMEVVGK